MEDCIFCRIIDGRVPSDKIYEDEQVYVFHDIAPHAKVHFLVIPKQHVHGLLQRSSDSNELLGYMFQVGDRIARDELALEGYKCLINAGEKGGQEVFHLHLHVLGGEPLSMPKPMS